MTWEDPDELLLMKLSREEYTQRMLTSLIVGGPYPRWNAPSIPSTKGTLFLESLYELAYEDHLNGPLTFVDEFELPPGSSDDRAGAPDYAVFWPENLWIIELKTEASSHRKEQLPLYLRLALHNYPKRKIQILYLTPEMHLEKKAGPEEHKFAHLFWSEVSHLIGEVWAESDEKPEQILEKALQRELSNLEAPAKIFRDTAHVVRQAIKLSLEVQKSGEQRAVEVSASGLDEIMELRMRIRDALRRLKGAEHVKPWIWHEKSSGGKPLTELGRNVGYELRLSRYKQP